jgi:hypothetical protein
MEQVLDLADETWGGRIESGLFPVGARRGCLRRSFTMRSAKTELVVCKGGSGDVLTAAVHVGYDCSEIREQRLVAIQQQHDYSGRTDVIQRCRSDESA